MKITRTNILNGLNATMEIPVTMAQLVALADPKRTLMIQELLPHLTPDEREFLMTGITPREWDKLFKPEGGDTIDSGGSMQGGVVTWNYGDGK